MCFPITPNICPLPMSIWKFAGWQAGTHTHHQGSDPDRFAFCQKLDKGGGL